MASRGRYSHALVARLPKSFQSVATMDGTCIDLERAREQHEDLVKCLRGLDIDVLEMAPEESSPLSVFSNVSYSSFAKVFLRQLCLFSIPIKLSSPTRYPLFHYRVNKPEALVFRPFCHLFLLHPYQSTSSRQLETAP